MQQYISEQKQTSIKLTCSHPQVKHIHPYKNLSSNGSFRHAIRLILLDGRIENFYGDNKEQVIGYVEQYLEDFDNASVHKQIWVQDCHESHKSITVENGTPVCAHCKTPYVKGAFTI